MKTYLRYQCPKCYAIFLFENSIPKEFICIKCKKEFKALEVIEELEKKGKTYQTTKSKK